MHASPVKFPSVENKNFKEYETSARHNSKCHRNSIQYISFACLPLSLSKNKRVAMNFTHWNLFYCFRLFFFSPKIFRILSRGDNSNCGDQINSFKMGGEFQANYAISCISNFILEYAAINTILKFLPIPDIN